jgi:thiol-disulfide isomerase/thioredoxin
MNIAVKLSTLVILASFWSFTTEAFSPQDFEVQSFQKSQSEDKVIIVDVAAKWCPTCKGQQKDLDAILKDPKYKEVVTYKVDFDNKDQVKALADQIGRPIPRQSTIVFLKGKEVVGFSVAERGDDLRAHLNKAL